MSRSTLFFALPVRSSWVSDGTVSHRAIGSPPPAADPRGEQSSIRALSTWNRATVGRRIKLLGHPFISGAIRTLCAPSVSRETAGSVLLRHQVPGHCSRFATASTDRRPLIGCSCGVAQYLSCRSDRIDQADGEKPSCVVRKTEARNISCSSSSRTSRFVPSVSRETSAALVLCQTLTEHTNGMRDAIVRGPRQAIQTSAAIGEQFSATDSDSLPTAGSLQSGSHLLYPQGSSILLPPPGEDASVSTVT